MPQPSPRPSRRDPDGRRSVIARLGFFALLGALAGVIAAVIAPASAFAYAVVVPDADEECVLLASQSVSLSISFERSVSVATSTFDTGAFSGSVLVPVLGDALRAPTATIDGAPLSLTRIDRDTATALVASLARARKSPALIALAGLELYRAELSLTEGRHVLVTENAPSIDFTAAVPRIVEPLRTFDTACTTPAIAIDVSLESPQPIGAVFTPFHDRVLSRSDDHHAYLEVQTAADGACHDLHIYLTTSEEKVASSALTYRDAECPGADGAGYLLVAAGPTVLQADETAAKDFVLVIDTSGSMEGEKIAQVQSALAAILSRIGEEDRFDLITFNTDAHAVFGELRSGKDRDAREHAAEVARTLIADGSTDIDEALQLGLGELSSMSTGRPRIILFLTDGEATEGVTDTSQILANVAARNETGARIYSFGAGDSVNTTLLDGLGRQTNASTHYIRPGSDIDAVLASFYAEVQAPIATETELETDGIDVRERLPGKLPDLFVGSNLFALAKYEASGAARLSFLGTTSAGRERFSTRGSILAQGTGHAFLPRLWASRRLGELLMEARANNGAAATVDELRLLAERFGFVTAWTPFVMDPEGNVDRSYENPTGDHTGSQAVGTSAAINDISTNSNAGAYSAGGVAAPIRQVLDRTFVKSAGYWTDTRAPKELHDGEVIDVHFGGERWSELVELVPELRELLAVGRSVIVEWRCHILRVSDPQAEGIELRAEDALPAELFAGTEERAAGELPARTGPPGAPGGLGSEAPSCGAVRGVGDTSLGWLFVAFTVVHARRRARERMGRRAPI